MEKQALKRESVDDGGPPEKRLRGEPEDPSIYSEKIRERLQNSSRTGQACDRCKVRRTGSLPSGLFLIAATSFLLGPSNILTSRLP